MFKVIGFALLLANGLEGFELGSTRFEYERIAQTSGRDRQSNPFEEKWITQKLDHFDPSNTATLQMQYFTNGQHYKPGGPIYFEIGGEWDVMSNTLGYTLIYEMAVNNGGYFVASEHRFYGDSFPSPYNQKKQIKFLTVQQALEDLSQLVEYIRKTVPGMANAKTFFSGCSYAGTMATWLKQKYPLVATGVWSSSGPIFAKHDFFEYNDIVSAAIRRFGGQKCFNAIRAGFDEMNRLITSNNIQKLRDLMNNSSLTYFDFSQKIWRDSFYLTLTSTFTGVIQYNDARNPKIKEICVVIIKADNPVTGIYNAYVKYELKSSRAKENADDSWFYQTCSAFGWYQTFHTSSKNILPVNTETKINDNSCRRKFGKSFTSQGIKANVDRTNAIYGGFHPGIPSNLLTTLGEYDPWRPVGLRPSADVTTPIITTIDAAHCSDYSQTAWNDHPEVAKTKSRIKSIVKSWLA